MTPRRVMASNPTTLFIIIAVSEIKFYFYIILLYFFLSITDIIPPYHSAITPQHANMVPHVEVDIFY